MAYTNIDDPSAYFQTALYTGNGNATNAITNDGNSDLQPDFVWVKRREGASDHVLQDSSRGFSSTTKLSSSSTQYENDTNSGGSYGITDPQWGYVSSVSSDGFNANVGTGTGDQVNKTSSTYVAWQWKANGGTTSSNTSGGVTSTVQVNQDAGFSIVTWTGDGANETIGHGLGTTPQVIITKDRDSANNWNMYHHKTNDSAPYNYPVALNLTVAASLATGSFGTSSSDINSNTFYLKYWYNYSGDMIAYCFAEKQGYSKFGKYVGNGNANGPFIYTGFKPAFLMIKDTGAAGNWFITDHKRNPFNLTDDWLVANGSGAETNYLNASSVDYLSNGFKLRTSYSETNTNARKYIYMAFAEHPFTTSTGIPTTAR